MAKLTSGDQHFDASLARTNGVIAGALIKLQATALPLRRSDQ
jgi:hypothetical protein